MFYIRIPIRGSHIHRQNFQVQFDIKNLSNGIFKILIRAIIQDIQKIDESTPGSRSGRSFQLEDLLI